MKGSVGCCGSPVPQSNGDSESHKVISPVPHRLVQEDGGPEDIVSRRFERPLSTEAPCRDGWNRHMSL